MQKIVIAAFVVAVLAAAGVVRAQDTPHMSGPQAEHKWLQQFVGQWDAAGEMCMDPTNPGAEKVKSTGTENTRALGDLWIMAEGHSKVMGMQVNSVLTLGYDPEKKKFVGTWIDSFTSYMWNYEGTLDEAGTTLTLETTGPGPNPEGKHVKFRETTEFKNKDHRVFTSAFEGADGEWTTLVTVDYQRKK